MAILPDKSNETESDGDHHDETKDERDEEKETKSMEDILSINEPQRTRCDETHMSEFYDIDSTFKDTLDALGPLSSHGDSIKTACLVDSTVIDWTCTCVTSLEMAALSVYVSFTTRNLVHLKLGQNQIGSNGCMLLGKALLTNDSIEILDLNGCNLTTSPYRPNYTGVTTLIKGLESKRSVLRQLNLSDCMLLPNGVRLLSVALAFHPTLTALDLSKNQAGLFNDKQGYMGIANLLRYSTHLISLDISSNPFHHEAITVLSSALFDNKTLTALNTSQCGFLSTLPDPHNIRFK